MRRMTADMMTVTRSDITRRVKLERRWLRATGTTNTIRSGIQKVRLRGGLRATTMRERVRLGNMARSAERLLTCLITSPPSPFPPRRCAPPTPKSRRFLKITILFFEIVGPLRTVKDARGACCTPPTWPPIVILVRTWKHCRDHPVRCDAAHCSWVH